MQVVGSVAHRRAIWMPRCCPGDLVISLLAGELMRMAHKVLLCAGLLSGAAISPYLLARQAQSADLQREQLAADDRAKLVRHPLLQWLLEYLRQRPKAALVEVVGVSDWLSCCAREV